MFLALREMRRAKARFGLLVGAIGLLVFLILFQQTLQAGLITDFVGGIRNQSAPVLVYSVDGRRNLQGSIIPPGLEEGVAASAGVAEAGRIAQGTFTVTAGGSLADAGLLGYEREGLGSPTTLTAGRLPSTPGEVVADGGSNDGFGLGATLTVEPGGLELTVVGVAEDAQILVQPTLYGTYDTYLRALAAANPSAEVPPPNAIGLEPASGVSPAELAEAVNAANPDADALTRTAAAEEVPAIDQINQSFFIVLLLYGLVVPFVTGLFFLIVTFQKAGALTLLRAIGAPASRLVASLLVQVVAVVGLGYLVGTGLYLPLTFGEVGDLGLSFQTGAVVGWAALLLAFGLASSLFAAQRVLRLDPMAATTGAGVGR